MEMAVLIVAFLLMALGFLGCFVNKIPGPILAFIGILLLKFVNDMPISGLALGIIAAIVILSYVLPKVLLPKLKKHIVEYGKAASWGATIGSILGLIILCSVGFDNMAVGIILLVVAIVVLPYLFALVFEGISKKDWSKAVPAAGGALIEYLCTTLLKLAVVGYSFYAMFAL